MQKTFWAYKYEYVAILDGAVIMTLELVGARMIAPFFGSTIFVWTAVIGVILGALSAGYWYGGKLADRKASDEQLARIMTLGALVLLVCLLLAPLSLKIAAGIGWDLRFQALLAALLLFAPFNVLAGTVSPYLVKLKLTTLGQAGSSVGRLYAAGTAGSILGTFLTGYWLIGLVGSRVLGLGLVLVLLGTTLLLSRRTLRWQRIGLGAITLALMGTPMALAAVPDGMSGLLFDTDSSYARYLVTESSQAGRQVRLLSVDNFGAESGVYMDNLDEPAFAYIRSFMEIAAVSPNRGRVLVIGGGTYTMPRMLVAKYPEMQVDVVEIDPKLDEIAQNYFGYRPDPRIHVVHADGRTFLNSNRTKYDLIYVDAFSSLTPPFALTTTQAIRAMSGSLSPGGAIAVNLVSAVQGERGKFLQAEYATYRSVMSAVTLTHATSGQSDYLMQNLILVAGKDRGVVARLSQGMTREPVSGLIPPAQVLTDDFAPVEHLLGR